MIDQDWTPVILRKEQSHQKPNKPKVILDENGDVKVDIKKVSTKMCQTIIQGRASKNMKQVDLARLCNLDVKVISDIEKGGCAYNCDHVNKIARALGIKIPRE